MRSARAGIFEGFGADSGLSGMRAVASALFALVLAAALAFPGAAFAVTGDGTRSSGEIEVIETEDDATDASTTPGVSVVTNDSAANDQKTVTVVEAAEFAAHAALGMSNVTIPLDNPDNSIDVGQLADSSFLYDAKIGDLALADSYYNNQTVKVRGEVVGDAISPLMDGGDNCWITLRDFDTGDTISVFVRTSDLDKIDTYGAYGRVGTTLEVQGTYHLDCLDHEGDSDIHATVVTWVASGRETPDVFDFGRLQLPLEVVMGGLVLAALYWLLRERSR